MEGKEVMRFIAGLTHEYSVREVEDIDYGYIYKIYALPDWELDEPVLKYTVYRYSLVEAFVQNIVDGHAMEGLNI